MRARLQGRPGPSLVQPYRDLAKLWGKEAVLAERASRIALCAPGIVLGVALTFAGAVPLFVRGLFDGSIDVVALAFLLALGRIVMALAALDVRSSFTGLAAGRELAFSSLVEPALLLALLGSSVLHFGTSLGAVHAAPFGLAGLLALGAFCIALIAETARIPIDNQETHYELTMMHEGLTLEYAGWQLAMVQAAAYIRQIAFLALAATLLPGPSALAVAWMALLAIAITAVETIYGRLRLFVAPQLVLTAIILAATSIGLRALGITS